MPISPTDPETGGGTRLRLAESGAEWDLPGGPARFVLAVPGTQVAIHWLELAGDLTQPQAAAAARLMLADASAAPLADLHLAAGRPENGQTPVALVPLALMSLWVADDPDLVIPSPLLIRPPAEGLVRRGLDHRGLAQAFSVEPELAALVAGDAPIAVLDEADYVAGLADALADPVLNLRQGAFARRRQWRADRGGIRRIALWVAALLLVTLILQFATITRYTFDADRMEEEAARLQPAGAAAGGPAFDRLAPALFTAIRATPNVALVRIDYRPDGSMGATVAVDTPATLAALRARIEGAGAATSGGQISSIGGRATAELVLRAA